MKLQVLHLPTASDFTSDDLNEFTYEELYLFVEKVSSGKVSHIQLTSEGNPVFFPEKILAESVITIIKD